MSSSQPSVTSDPAAGDPRAHPDRPRREAPEPPDLTRLLERWRRGDDEAIAEVLPHFYARLRRLGQYLMSRERSDHTLEATALVHEAYMRLLALRAQHWSDRDQFFTRCAFLMRNVLVDHARRHGAQRRGGGVQHQTLDPALHGAAEGKREIVLAVDEALERLVEVDPELAKLVMLRYFAGMTFPEIASLAEVSESTVKREWRVARAWLGACLEDAVDTEPGVEGG